MKSAKPTKAAVKPAPSPLSLEVDELGTLERWTNTLAGASYAAKFARIDVLKKAIRERFATAPPGEPQQAHGELYTVLLGVQSPPCEVAFTRAGSRTLKVFAKGE